MIEPIAHFSHPFLKKLKKIKTMKKWRERFDLVPIFSKKVILDLAKSYTFVDFMSSDQPTHEIKAQNRYQASEEVMEKWGGQGEWVATMALPQPQTLVGKKWVLILDRVQDPGNLGNLFRTAFSLGWEGIFLIGGCDPFNDKAVSAARGSSFLLPYETGDFETILKRAHQEQVPLFITAMEGESPKPQTKGAYLVLGNEGEGVNNAYPHDQTLSIPMSQGFDSLNVSVAGGIFLYVLRG